jgi:hypothetical protein
MNTASDKLTTQRALQHSVELCKYDMFKQLMLSVGSNWLTDFARV